MKLLIKIVILIIAIFLYFHWPSEAKADVNPAVAVQPQEETQESASVVLERARILERVDRDYGEALQIFQTLIDQKPAPEILEKAELGAVNCFMKLGRYDEAKTILETIATRNLAVETVERVEDLLASIARLNSKDRSESASSVDNLVWQFLDIIVTDSDRSTAAQSEIIELGVLAVPILQEAAHQREYVRSVKAFIMLVSIGGEGVFDFIDGCVKSPDLALRKRCLDGLTGSRSLPVELVPSLMTMLDDREESLQAGALSCFRRQYRHFHGQLGPQIARITGRLLEFYESDRQRLRDEAFYTATELVEYLDRAPVKEFPLEEIVAITGNMLDENYLLSSGGEREFPHLKRAMWMANILGTKFGCDELVIRLSKFWLIDEPRRLGNLGAWRENLVRTADHLPVEALDQIARKLTESGSVDACDDFASFCPYSAFSRLPVDTQTSFVDKWARNVENLTTGSMTNLFQKIDKTTPAIWAAFVTSALENDDPEVKKTCLALVHGCPDPSDAVCVDTFSRWAARATAGGFQPPWRIIERLIKNGTMDPGRSGALRVLESGLEAIKEPLHIWRFQGGSFTFSPTSAQEVVGIIDDCQGFGNPGDVQQWILDQDRPGLHDYLVVCENTKNTIKQLLKLDRGFALKLWPHLSSAGQEALFEKVASLVGNSYLNAKPDWLLDLIAKIESLDGWDNENIQYLLRYLGKWREPSVPDLAFEIARIVFENPDSYGARYDSIENLGDLLEVTAPRSEKVMSLIPEWYAKIIGEYTNYAPQMYHIVKESRANLRQALSWLAEDHHTDLKHNVLGGITRVEASVLKQFNLEEELQAVWPALDHPTRALLLYYLAMNNDSIAATTGFLTFVLCDETVDPAFRHMALPALLLSSQGCVIDPVLEYLAQIEPGAGDEPMVFEGDFDFDLKDRTAWLFELLFSVRTKGDFAEVSCFTDYEPQDRQRLFRGILELPVLHPRLRSVAARKMEVDSLNDLETMIAAIAEGDCYYPFEKSVNYLLTRAQAAQEGDEASRIDFLGRAESLLVAALSGEFEKRNENVDRLAVETVKKFRVEKLLPHVGQIAVGHSNADMRYEAVACLGCFVSKDSVPFLIECLKDQELEVRKAALSILERMRSYEEQREVWNAMLNGKTGSGEPKDPSVALIKMLHHEDAEIRLAAIKSLGKLADPNTLPVLVQMMADGTPEERAAAKAAIDAITAE